jgi:hypothetical protein
MLLFANPCPSSEKNVPDHADSLHLYCITGQTSSTGKVYRERSYSSVGIGVNA